MFKNILYSAWQCSKRFVSNNFVPFIVGKCFSAVFAVTIIFLTLSSFYIALYLQFSDNCCYFCFLSDEEFFFYWIISVDFAISTYIVFGVLCVHIFTKLVEPESKLFGASGVLPAFYFLVNFCFILPFWAVFLYCYVLPLCENFFSVVVCSTALFSLLISLLIVFSFLLDYITCFGFKAVSRAVNLMSYRPLLVFLVYFSLLLFVFWFEGFIKLIIFW